MLSDLEVPLRGPGLTAPTMHSSRNYSPEAGYNGVPPRPRYMPGLADFDEPWSTWRMSSEQLQRSLPSDTSLFASLPTGVHQYVRQNTIDTAPVADDANVVSMDFETDLDNGTRSSDDTLDEPPSGDPVGPPPQLPSPSSPQAAGQSHRQNRKGGRRGPLEPNKREKAGMMRKTRACWHCIFLRNSVRIWHCCSCPSPN